MTHEEALRVRVAYLEQALRGVAREKAAELERVCALMSDLALSGMTPSADAMAQIEKLRQNLETLLEVLDPPPLTEAQKPP
jgi:hypothetical protein